MIIALSPFFPAQVLLFLPEFPVRNLVLFVHFFFFFFFLNTFLCKPLRLGFFLQCKNSPFPVAPSVLSLNYTGVEFSFPECTTMVFQPNHLSCPFPFLAKFCPRVPFSAKQSMLLSPFFLVQCPWSAFGFPQKNRPLFSFSRLIFFKPP